MKCGSLEYAAVNGPKWRSMVVVHIWSGAPLRLVGFQLDTAV